MKSLWSAALFCLLGVGLANAQTTNSPTGDDARFQQKIVGIWVMDFRSSNGAVIKRTSTIKSDGTLVAKASVALDENEEKINYEATWRISRGIYIETVTKSDSGFAKPGTVSFDKIISFDDDKYVYRTMEGETITCLRKK